MQTLNAPAYWDKSIRLNDLPTLLAPYAKTAPVYVYILACGTVQATRFRLRENADLLLVLAPRGAVPQLQ